MPVAWADSMTDKATMARKLEMVAPDWDSIAGRSEFQHLVGLKKTFIVPAFVIFLVHFFALAVLVGYFPHLASTRVMGTITLAYIFALSQFVVGWVIAGLYLLAATKFDAVTKDLLAQIGSRPEDL